MYRLPEQVDHGAADRVANIVGDRTDDARGRVKREHDVFGIDARTNCDARVVVVELFVELRTNRDSSPGANISRTRDP